MLLFLSSAGVRRAAVANGPALAAAFVARAPSARALPSPSVAAALARASSARFMSTDAVAGEKTEEEKAAIKAAREARK